MVPSMPMRYEEGKEGLVLELTAQQQLAIFKALHKREKEPWYTMTTEERKACTVLAISVVQIVGF